MKVSLYVLPFLFLLSSCSGDLMVKMMAKTPELTDDSYKKEHSKYLKDGTYLIQYLRDNYPRLEEKEPQFSINCNQFKKNLTLVKDEVTFEILLKRFLSSLKDGHTYSNVDFSKMDSRVVGFMLYHDFDRWVIGNVDKSIDSSVIGGELVSINGISVHSFEEKIKSIESGENSYYQFHQFKYGQPYVSYWKTLGIISDSNEIFKLEIKLNNKSRFFNSYPIDKGNGYAIGTKVEDKFTLRQKDDFYDTIISNKNLAYLQMNSCLDLVCIKEGIDNYTNKLSKSTALRYIKKEYPNSLDFGKFLVQFFKKIEAHKIDNLVLDLRYNTGGDSRLGKQFLWYLDSVNEPLNTKAYFKNSLGYRECNPEIYKEYNDDYFSLNGIDLPKKEISLESIYPNELFFEDLDSNRIFTMDSTITKFGGSLYVVIGNQTFSAGNELATIIKDNGYGELVGEPSGNKPSCATGVTMVKLPYTKSIVYVSGMFLERPNSKLNNKEALYPDVHRNKSLDDIINGVDPAMEYIYERSSRKKQ